MAKHDRPYRTDPRRWARVRWQVFKRDGFRCVKCGKAARLECDHIIPIDAGGDPWALSNLQSLCRGCHIGKTREENHARRAAEANPDDKTWAALVDALSA